MRSVSRKGNGEQRLFVVRRAPRKVDVTREHPDRTAAPVLPKDTPQGKLTDGTELTPVPLWF